MVKTKEIKESSCILPSRSRRMPRFHSSRHLLSKAKKALMQNIEISRFLLVQLSQFTWDIQSSHGTIVSIHSCPICEYNYNNHSHSPICLPCGHTICKKCVHSLHASLLTGFCPFDRKEYYFINELLPINHSLLFSETKPDNKICIIHGMAIIGYCTDDNNLLCGKCIFPHKSHHFLDLDSPQVQEIVHHKMDNIRNLEQQMHKLLEIWQGYKEFIKGTVERIDSASGLEKSSTEKKEDLGIISKVKEYIKKILEDLEESEVSANPSICKVVENIQENLEKLKTFRENFDSMHICDKLILDTGKELEFESVALIKITGLISELEEHFHKI